MALVYNCNDDVAFVTFVSGLQITHSFYKHLVKYEVTKTREIFSRAQKYIQIKDATQSVVDCTSKMEDKGKKSKLPSPAAFSKNNQNRPFSAIYKQPTRNLAKSYREEADFTLFKISVTMSSMASRIKSR